MKISKSAVAVSVALTGLVVSSSALAMPGFTKPAPDSSIKQCIALIGEEANYNEAVRVRHVVGSEERRVGGHTILIDTQVFGADGTQLIREYATFCVVTAAAEPRKFRIREKS